MEFKLNGQKMEGFSDYSPARIKKYLDKLPDGELLTSVELADRLKIKSANSMRDKIKIKLPAYYCIMATKCLWGNPKTVKAFKDEIQS